MSASAPPNAAARKRGRRTAASAHRNRARNRRRGAAGPRPAARARSRPGSRRGQRTASAERLRPQRYRAGSVRPRTIAVQGGPTWARRARREHRDPFWCLFGSGGGVRVTSTARVFVARTLAPRRGAHNARERSTSAGRKSRSLEQRPRFSGATRQRRNAAETALVLVASALLGRRAPSTRRGAVRAAPIEARRRLG